MSGEREEAATKLQQLVETHELLQSEMASVQSDLATANSLANTHKLTAEKVREVETMVYMCVYGPWGWKLNPHGTCIFIHSDMVFFRCVIN